MSTYVGDLKKPSIGVATVWLGWVSWFITRVYGRLVGGGQISDPGGGKRVGLTTAFVGAALTRLPSRTALRLASSVVESCEKLWGSGSAFADRATYLP
jgi:hypothetical protein